MNNDPTKVNILYARIVDEQGLLQELSDNIVEYFADKGKRMLFIYWKLFQKFNLYVFFFVNLNN